MFYFILPVMGLGVKTNNLFFTVTESLETGLIAVTTKYVLWPMSKKIYSL